MVELPFLPFVSIFGPAVLTFFTIFAPLPVLPKIDARGKNGKTDKCDKLVKLVKKVRPTGAQKMVKQMLKSPWPKIGANGKW